MFFSSIKKNNVYPCKPQFYYIKVGFKGVTIMQACFRDEYFDNLIRNCTGAFSTMTVWSYIKFTNINALFLVTYAEFILAFVKTTK